MKRKSAPYVPSHIFVRGILSARPRLIALLIFGVSSTLLLKAAPPASDEPPQQLWKYALRSATAFLAVAPNASLYALETQGSTGSATLHALNPKGSELWHKSFNFGAPFAAPIFAPDGTAYILVGDRITAFAPDGRIAWSYIVLAQLSQMSPFTPCLARGPDGTLYSGGAYLYAFRPDGTLKWQTRMKDRVPVSCPAFSPRGQLFVSSEKGLHRISADGQELDVLRGVVPNAKPAGTHDGAMFFVGKVAMTAANYNVDNALFAVGEDGRLLWQFAQGPRIAGVLFTRQGIVVGGGVMDLLNAKGEIVWSLETPVNANAAALPDGTFLGGCSEGADLCAYDAKGEIRWYFAPSNSPRNFQPTPVAAGPGGEVYLVKGNTLLALQAPRTSHRK